MLTTHIHDSATRAVTRNARIPHNLTFKSNTRPATHRGAAAQRSQGFVCRSTPADRTAAVPAVVSSVVTDEAVPEAHKGLHGFLYGEGGAAEAHGDGNQASTVEGEDDGDTMLTIWEYLARRGNEKPVGVYAVYNDAGVLQYIGYSRNIVLSLKTHRAKLGGERCASVRAKTFLDKAIHSRANLEREVQQWVDAQDTLPPGNGPEAELWSSTAVPAVEAMSEEEKQVHAEQKLKLQKAMGTKMKDEPEAEQGTEEWRQQMKAAVEGSDWSAVISEQTNQTIAPDSGAVAAPAPAAEAGPGPGTSGDIVSPFTTEAAQRDVQAEGSPVATALTVEAVSACLDDVRPYLVADGGDVDVVGVENGVVLLQLVGACSSCPSQSSTMKMGIESAIKRRFGDLVKDIIQVNPLPPGATVELVDRHLDMLRSAVAGLGGSVEVMKVEGGVCELKYNGPPAIGKGLSGAIRDQFPDIREVRLV